MQRMNAAVQEGLIALAVLGVLTSVVSVFFYLRIVVMMYMTDRDARPVPPPVSSVAMGLVGGKPFIGLPGNPVAVFVTFAFIARTVIALLSGARPIPLRGLPVRLDFSHEKKAGRCEYLRVVLTPGADGVAAARKHPRDGAGALTSLTETDGLVEIAADLTAAAKGTIAPFFAYEMLTG